MSASRENHHYNRLLAAGLGVSGIAAAGGILAVRNHLARPEDLNDPKAVSNKRGAVILTASALALRVGETMTFAEVRDVTQLTRVYTSWGVNFLLERGLAEREQVPRHPDYLWASEPLLDAALVPESFPNLESYMKLLASQQAPATGPQN